MLRRRWNLPLLCLGVLLLAPIAPAGASASPTTTAPSDTTAAVPRQGAAPSAVAVGYGGAVATVDADATRVGLQVLRAGGNAVDAAIAAAATLGVTEPFSSGIGGGGFLVYYDARTRTVHTIDGRETAPGSMTPTSFVNPATGTPYDFQQARVSGLSAGVPGSPATWAAALQRWGTMPLSQALRPAIGVAEHGFVVDDVFRGQVASNLDAFGRFSSTSALYLPGGAPPPTGSVFRNPDLARTYRLMARDGVGVLYHGAVARDIVSAIQRPPVAAQPIGSWPYPVLPGGTTLADLGSYQVRYPEPTRVSYHGLDVYGMPTPSSGGSTVGEALNILAASHLSGRSTAEVLHDYLEASALAFADRNRYVGDGTPRAVLNALLDPAFGAQRACRIDPGHAFTTPVAPGVPGVAGGGCAPAAGATAATSTEAHTTNLTVADRWGNVVEYTLTIEQIGGNAIVVPHRGFLLNNELTDFDVTPTEGTAPDPNLPAPGKRPRSSMAPTILVRDGRPALAVGSPGGATIITTVLQILVNRLDLGMSLPQAIAAPRASQRNTPATQAEPAFLATPDAARLQGLGHMFTSTPEIGAATGVEFLGHGRVLAAAEPVRRGGGSAGVVVPAG